MMSNNFEFGGIPISHNKRKESFGKIREIFFEDIETQKKLFIKTDNYNIIFDSVGYINVGERPLTDYEDKELLCIERANFVRINPKKLDSAFKDDPIFIYAPNQYEEIEVPYIIITLHLDNGKNIKLWGKFRCNIKIGKIDG